MNKSLTQILTENKNEINKANKDFYWKILSINQVFIMSSTGYNIVNNDNFVIRVYNFNKDEIIICGYKEEGINFIAELLNEYNTIDCINADLTVIDNLTEQLELKTSKTKVIINSVSEVLCLIQISTLFMISIITRMITDSSIVLNFISILTVVLSIIFCLISEDITYSYFRFLTGIFKSKIKKEKQFYIKTNPSIKEIFLYVLSNRG